MRKSQPTREIYTSLMYTSQTHQVGITNGGQELPNTGVQKAVYGLGLVRDGVLQGSDDCAADKGGTNAQVLLELREQSLRMNESQLPYTLSHNIPGAFLWTLKVLEENIPTAMTHNRLNYKEPVQGLMS